MAAAGSPVPHAGPADWRQGGYEEWLAHQDILVQAEELAANRKELEAIADGDERELRVRQATAVAQENAKALNAAQIFEIDDVIDPAETRGLIAATLTTAGARGDLPPPRRFVDTW